MSRRPLPNIWRSYGAQLCIIDYYSHSKIKVLQLQLINRESYNRTIGRCQSTFPIRNEMFVFTFPLVGKLQKCIMILNGVTGEVQKFEHDSFNFKNTLTVVVKKELYAFKYGGPVSAYKIANFFSGVGGGQVRLGRSVRVIADFFSNDRLVKTTLSTLPRDE